MDFKPLPGYSYPAGAGLSENASATSDLTLLHAHPEPRTPPAGARMTPPRQGPFLAHTYIRVICALKTQTPTSGLIAPLSGPTETRNARYSVVTTGARIASPGVPGCAFQGV